MKHYFSVYATCFRTQLMAMAEYRADFWVGFASILLEQGLSLVFIMAVFGRIQDVNGWVFGELLLIYSIASFSRAIHLIFFDNLWGFGWKYVRSGLFDRILVRPVNALFQIVSERLHFTAVSQLLIAFVAIVYSSSLLNLQWTPMMVIMMIIFAISGGVIYASIQLFIMTLSFWMTNSDPIVWGVFESSMFAKYPLSIFPKIIRVGLMWVVPYAFSAVIPAQYFFKEFNGEHYSTLSIATPAVAVASFAISYSFWRFGMSRYTSTGS